MLLAEEMRARLDAARVTVQAERAVAEAEARGTVKRVEKRQA